MQRHITVKNTLLKSVEYLGETMDVVHHGTSPGEFALVLEGLLNNGMTGGKPEVGNRNTENKTDALSGAIDGNPAHAPGDIFNQEIRDKPDVVDKTAVEDNPDPVKNLFELIKSCRKCPLGARRKQHIPFSGSTSTRLMLLTDMPDYYDEVQGTYYAGPAGELLDAILRSLSLNRSSFYITGALKCTSAIQIGSDVEPYAICLEYLNKELSLLNPSFILAFGELAYRILFQKNDFALAKGALLQWNNTPVLFTHHPRELLHDPALKKETWQHLKRCRDLLLY